jgi:SAM-dependent methyltransferase
MNEIQNKVNELATKAPWNHNFDLKGISTIENQKYSIGNNKIKWERISKLVDFKSKKVLDLGCSDGYFSCKSLEAGAKQVSGIDLDRLRIEKANFIKSVYNYTNIDFSVRDVYKIDLDKERYDLILCLGLLHRIPDMNKLLKKISNTKILVIETKIYDTDEAKCKWGGGDSKSNQYNNLYNIPSFNYLKLILKLYGFTDIKTDIDKRDQNNYKRGLLICSRKRLVRFNSREKNLSEI